MRILRRSAKTIRGHYFPGSNWRSRDWCLAGCAAGELLPCRARAAHTVETASLLELLARYGYDVKPDMTPREQRRVIMAFQMHFRPTLYNGEADAETQAIAEALLEKYGQD